jgi:hypothetical protein
MSEHSAAELLARLDERQQAQGRELDEIRDQLAGLAASVRALCMAEQGRTKFLQGVRVGAQSILVAIAAAAGAGVSKILDWIK